MINRTFAFQLFVTGILLIGVFTESMSQVDAFRDAMDKLTNPVFHENKPGGIVLVIKNGKTVYQRLGGIADLDENVEINENTIFNTGSISKTFVSNAILILHEQGKLSIDDPLSKYFSDFDDHRISDAVTIKHLLSHTSGLPDLRNVREQQEFYMTAKDTANFEPIKRTTKFNFTPGSQFQYSNPAYNGLALIVEKVSGQKWQDFIAENIFAVAGMKHSTITDGPHPESGVAHAYVKDGQGFEEYDYGEFPTFAASGNGGVWCSAGDLVRYETALREGKIISRQLLEESRTIYHPENWSSNDPPYIGYSWFVRSPDKSVPFEVVYHTGSQGGFRAFHVSIEEHDITYVALFNYPPDSRGIMNAGLELIAEHLLK